jgi:hypothetical protein
MARRAASVSELTGGLNELTEVTAALLDDVRAFLEQYVVLAASEAIAVALWVAHTHAIAAADCTPYLAITSAEKQSGKSTLLDVLELMVANPWITGGASAGALVRKISSSSPTLLLDEVDAAFGGSQEYTQTVRGILDSGFKRGRAYSMCVGGSGAPWQVRDFDVFGAKALAGLGDLPDTIASRSIPIRMRPKLRSEPVVRLRTAEAKENVAPLRERLTAWAQDALDELHGARPDLPDCLGHRSADVWEPLLAIAELAGSRWRAAAHDAAGELSSEAGREESLGVRLLADIRAVFVGAEMASEDLVNRLAALPDSPWGGYSRDWGPVFTTRALARMLKPFAIQSQAIWFGKQQRKGYYREAFDDAWNRHLPLPEGLNKVNKVNASHGRVVDPVEVVEHLEDIDDMLF